MIKKCIPCMPHIIKWDELWCTCTAVHSLIVIHIMYTMPHIIKYDEW